MSIDITKKTEIVKYFEVERHNLHQINLYLDKLNIKPSSIISIIDLGVERGIEVNGQIQVIKFITVFYLKKF